jgi:D-3-phosphoglycerate dehydrogenase
MHILIADAMHPSIMPMLEEKGFTADYLPKIQRSEIIDALQHYHGMIIRSKTHVDEALLAKANNLQFIARAGAGLDLIDLEAVSRRNIQLFNAPEGNRDAVAEHAIGMLLCLFNKLHTANQQVRNKVWDREGNRGVELGGKTVGLIGYGNMGRAFARRLSAFGCKVLAFDKYLTGFSDAYTQEVAMEELFEKCQVLSLHVPLTPETNKLVNTDFINHFSHPFYIINTARGEIITLNTLQEGLQSGKVLGACLDVLENEKLQTLTPVQQAAFSYLASSEQVLFSPHVAGWTHESYVRINEVLVEKISAWYAG